MFFGHFQVVPFKAASVKITRNEEGKAIGRDVTRFEGGFHVASSVTDSFDSLYDAINHPAVFRTVEQAQAFADKLARSRTKINLSNWIIGNHPCAAYQRAPAANPGYYSVI